RVFLPARGLRLDYDGVFCGRRRGGISAVSADAVTLLSAAGRQYQRILSGLPHHDHGCGQGDPRTGTVQFPSPD
ncbi:MAG TPA: hypothetical protein VK670_12745, partial [Silvibacterium sp.]|nr:hypothetical protein [Silvibacterium sp.]